METLCSSPTPIAASLTIVPGVSNHDRRTVNRGRSAVLLVLLVPLVAGDPLGDDRVDERRCLWTDGTTAPPQTSTTRNAEPCWTDAGKDHRPTGSSSPSRCTTTSASPEQQRAARPGATRTASDRRSWPPEPRAHASRNDAKRSPPPPRSPTLPALPASKTAWTRSSAPTAMTPSRSPWHASSSSTAGDLAGRRSRTGQATTT